MSKQLLIWLSQYPDSSINSSGKGLQTKRNQLNNAHSLCVLPWFAAYRPDSVFGLQCVTVREVRRK